MASRCGSIRGCASGAFGSWEGLTREDIAALPERARHDGETDDEVRERVLAAVQSIADGTPAANRCSSSPTAAR